MNGLGAPVAVYSYTDENGVALFDVLRYAPKDFRQRCADGSWTLGGVRRVPYNLSKFLEAKRTGRAVLVCEGEKDCDALNALGFIATTNAGGASWTWTPEFLEEFRGLERVILITDSDKPGRAAVFERSRALLPFVNEVRTVELAPDRDDGYDVSDWLAEGHTKTELKRIIEAAAQVVLEPDEVEHVDEAPAAPLEIELNELLAQIALTIGEYVHASEYQLAVMALWAFHTHAIAAFETTPYLSITSPLKQCGKSRTLDVLNLTVANPWLTSRVSAAVLVRKVDNERPTLLLDESDAAFSGDKEYAETLRGVLNSGFAINGKASLCVKAKGGEFKAVDFSTFCAKVVCGIGRLPDTIEDRSIPIRLERKPHDKKVRRFRRRSARAIFEPLQVTAAHLASQYLPQLSQARPEIPEELGDRAQDVCEPLLCIADLAGGSWPKRSREALVALFASDPVDDDDRTTRLLEDIRTAFDECDQDAKGIASASLARRLSENEGAPYLPPSGKGIFDASSLARGLKKFKIKPTQLWIDGRNQRGYERASFSKTWERYLLPSPKGANP